MKLIYEVPGNDFDRAGEASARVKKALQRLGVPADVVRRVAIGTYEGEMNALIHAGGGTVQADINTENTVITVKDAGPGISDVKQAMQEGFSTAPDYVRALGFGAGMGLPNMMKCSDKFAIDTAINKGTKITMCFEHKHS
jgi:serine/threonine-protein kinase RsbT